MLQTIKGKQIERNTILTGGINDHLSIVGNLDFGGFIISSSGMPTNQYDLVNKFYVDSVSAGFDPKQSCKVATTTNITLSGLSSIDSILLYTNDRVLVKDQIDKKQNGIYLASAGIWSRSLDMDGNPDIEVSKGNFTFIETGATNHTSGWV